LGDALDNRVLFILTYRSDDLRHGHTLYSSPGTLQRRRGVQSLALGHFSTRGSCELIDASLEDHKVTVPLDVRRELAALTRATCFSRKSC